MTRTATRKKADPAVPFSRTAQRLIEQPQAEAQAATLEALSAKDGITVLHGLDAKTMRWDFLSSWDEHILGTDGRGSVVDFHRDRYLPECWAGHATEKRWHPSYWWGSITLVDGNGASWRRQLNRMVCNDFGDLVAVDGGQP